MHASKRGSPYALVAAVAVAVVAAGLPTAPLGCRSLTAQLIESVFSAMSVSGVRSKVWTWPWSLHCYDVGRASSVRLLVFGAPGADCEAQPGDLKVKVGSTGTPVAGVGLWVPAGWYKVKEKETPPSICCETSGTHEWTADTEDAASQPRIEGWQPALVMMRVVLLYQKSRKKHGWPGHEHRDKNQDLPPWPENRWLVHSWSSSARIGGGWSSPHFGCSFRHLKRSLLASNAAWAPVGCSE
ncbi:hypothetical protein BKA80DRAFT_254093 [Phyllosticta citrichinensis]